MDYLSPRSRLPLTWRTVPAPCQQPNFWDLLHLVAALPAEAYPGVIVFYERHLAELACFLHQSQDALLQDHRFLAGQLLGRFRVVQSVVIQGLLDGAREWITMARLHHVAVVMPRFESGLTPSVRVRVLPEALDARVFEDRIVRIDDCHVVTTTLDGSPIFTLKHNIHCSAAKLSPNGRYAAVNDGEVGSIRDFHRMGGSVGKVSKALGCFSPTSEHYAYSIGSEAVVMRLYPTEHAVVHDFGLTPWPVVLDWGLHLVLACGNTVCVMTLDLSAVLHNLHFRDYHVSSVAASLQEDAFALVPAGMLLVVRAGIEDEECKELHRGTEDELRVVWVDDHIQVLPYGLVFEADDLEVVTTLEGRLVHSEWCLREEQPPLLSLKTPIVDVAGSMVALWEGRYVDAQLTLFDVDSGDVLASERDMIWASRPRFSPDGSYLALDDCVYAVKPALDFHHFVQERGRPVAWLSDTTVAYEDGFVLDVTTEEEEMQRVKIDDPVDQDYHTVRDVVLAGTGFSFGSVGFAHVFTRIASMVGPMTLRTTGCHVSLGSGSVGFWLDEPCGLRCYPYAKGLLVPVPSQVEGRLGMLEVQF